jgi:hypothetical protein
MHREVMWRGELATGECRSIRRTYRTSHIAASLFRSEKHDASRFDRCKSSSENDTIAHINNDSIPLPRDNTTVHLPTDVNAAATCGAAQPQNYGDVRNAPSCDSADHYCYALASTAQPKTTSGA